MDVTDFRPRVDRDNLVLAGQNPTADYDHLPVQFLQQDYDNYEYETKKALIQKQTEADKAKQKLIFINGNEIIIITSNLRWSS